MESDESAHPKQPGLLGTQAVVAVPDSLTHLVEQAGRLQRRTRAGFHGLVDTALQASGARPICRRFRCLCAVRAPGCVSAC
jgi:hypothetical protein